MKTFRQLRESTAKVAVITFGRFNPPTIGHEKMIKRIAAVARKYGGDAFVFASGSQDAKKNPLPYDEKIKLMTKMFPNREHKLFKYGSKKLPTVMHAASELHKDGYEELVMVVGSDRVNQFKKLLPDYNGVSGKPHGFYDFQKITIESAGERDPDADGAEGMSASKMRQFVADGDYDTFAEGMPNTLNDMEKRRVYQSLRKHMRLRVIENIIRKQVSEDPIVNKNESIVSFDNLVEYLYNLPYQPAEKLYIDKVSSHIDQLIKETEYYSAKNQVEKIKSYINLLDEQSGMVDFEICDLHIFDSYLEENYTRKEYELKPLSERLQSTIKEGDLEKAAGALAIGLAMKYGYDKLIKAKFSRKERISQLQDKIEKLRDQKRSWLKMGRKIDADKQAQKIADLQKLLGDEQEKISKLNVAIKKAKEKK